MATLYRRYDSSEWLLTEYAVDSNVAETREVTAIGCVLNSENEVIGTMKHLDKNGYPLPVNGSWRPIVKNSEGDELSEWTRIYTGGTGEYPWELYLVYAYEEKDVYEILNEIDVNDSPMRCDHDYDCCGCVCSKHLSILHHDEYTHEFIVRYSYSYNY